MSTHATIINCQSQFKTSASQCRQSTFNRFTRRRTITAPSELINHLKNESVRNWSCSMSQWYSTVCDIGRFTRAWRSDRKAKKPKITTSEDLRCFEIMKISSEYCCLFFSVLFSCRLSLETAVSGRIMAQTSGKAGDIAEELKRHTIRNDWSSLQEALTELSEKYVSRSMFSISFQRVTKPSLHRMQEIAVIMSCRHRIGCMGSELWDAIAAWISRVTQHCNSIECRKTRMSVKSRRTWHHFRSPYNCGLAAGPCEQHEVSSNTRTFRTSWDSCRVNSESTEQVDWRALGRDWTSKTSWSSCRVNSKSAGWLTGVY